MTQTTGTTLGRLLKPYSLSEVARQIDRPRQFVWRLRWGQPLYDDAVIPALAKVLRLTDETLRKIVADDIVTVRKERRERRKGRAA